MKRTAFKGRTTPLRTKTRIRIVGHSDTATTKRNIQALLRQIVMIRDKGCILRNARHCGGTLDTAGVVIQADHLISRANSATYGDSRLVVCVCKGCHAWKSLGSNRNKGQYDALVKTILPAERVALWERCEEESWRPSRVGASDWRLTELVLTAELAALRNRG